jgi:hypothetical protein
VTLSVHPHTYKQLEDNVQLMPVISVTQLPIIGSGTSSGGTSSGDKLMDDDTQNYNGHAFYLVCDR